MITVDLIRHAESADNARKGYIGGQNISVDLSTAGVDQAALLGQNYSPGIESLIVSSTAKRAIRTAEIAFAGFEGLTDKRFLEQQQGIHEDQLVTAIWTDNEKTMADTLGWDYKPAGGESWSEVADRMFAGIEVYEGNADKLVVVSSSTAIKSVIAKTLREDQLSGRARPLSNTHISRLQKTGRGWSVLFANAAPFEAATVNSY